MDFSYEIMCNGDGLVNFISLKVQSWNVDSKINGNGRKKTKAKKPMGQFHPYE